MRSVLEFCIPAKYQVLERKKIKLLFVASVKIVPHGPGNDFVGTDYDGGYHYIIRSDLGVVMR